MNSPRKCYLIPPNEQPCLWMSAGVVSYQLCDRMFDCNHCLLDQAMRRRFPAPAAIAEQEFSDLVPMPAPEIPEEEFHYTRNHWWVRRIGPGLVRLGIESGLAQALLGLKGIVFPSPKQHLQQGQSCIWVVMDGGTVPLEAPLAGKVRGVNRELITSPHLLILQPFAEGWLCELEIEEVEVEAADLLTAEEARTKYKNDQVRFMASLANVVRGKRSAVGLTLVDGGEKLRSFAEMLGLTRYFSLVRQYFGWNKR
jgi:glycine cleavage system H protein